MKKFALCLVGLVTLSLVGCSLPEEKTVQIREVIREVPVVVTPTSAPFELDTPEPEPVRTGPWTIDNPSPEKLAIGARLIERRLDKKRARFQRQVVLAEAAAPKITVVYRHHHCH